MNAPVSSDESAARRRRMIESQLRPSGVTDLALLAAFGAAPREAFVEPAYAPLAYFDGESPALQGAGRLLLAPTTLARLIQAARLQPGERALDVAGGSGYGALIMAALGAKVVALETPAAGQGAKTALAGASGVECVAGDIAAGAPGRGPFDVILVNGAFEVAPEALIAQLAEGGRLVGVDASYAAAKAALIEKAGGAATRRALFDSAGAPKLEAFLRPAQFAF